MRKSVCRKMCGASLKHCDSGVNHGTFLHIAHEEGLIRNTSMHAGIRAPVIRPKGDVRNDVRCGFEIVKARAIDRVGVTGIIDKLKSRVAGTKVYISVDIDVLDPAFAPGKSLCRTSHERPALPQQYLLHSLK
jgi:agmatinase